MAYSFARVSATVAMQAEGYFGQGKWWWVQLHAKGGKVYEMPCHHNLDAYLHAAGIAEAKKTPLFRSARGRTGELTGGLRPILCGPRMSRPSVPRHVFPQEDLRRSRLSPDRREPWAGSYTPSASAIRVPNSAQISNS